LARVANALDAAGLGTNLQVASQSDGWQYFVVRFAGPPDRRGQVEGVITDAGGFVLRAPPLAATGGPRATFWARVSNCACAGDPYARVSRDFAAAHLNVDLALGPATKDWLTFSATIDPRATSSSDVTSILRNDGAEILDQPPRGVP
jgi:hypothetical protein